MTHSHPLTRKTLRDGHQVHLRYALLFFFILWHALALLCFFYFSWWALLAMAIGLWFCGGLGITLGYHRLLTHRSFQTFKPLEYFLTLCGTLNWQGSPATWVGTHRLHHRDSDQAADPHSPKDGFAWSHIFWMMYTDHPGEDPRGAPAKDLLRDKTMAFIDRYWYLTQVAAIALSFGTGWLIGGFHEAMAWVLWACVLRVILMYHGTWFVNSAAHTWGYRNFQTADDSRNNWWVALISFGEGWHNNHHAQQRSAAHGMRWFELDLTYYTILLLEHWGLVWKVVRPKVPSPKTPAELKPLKKRTHEPAFALASTDASR